MDTPRILVIDDDLNFLNLAKDYINLYSKRLSQKVRVEIVSDPKEGITLAVTPKGLDISLVLLDLHFTRSRSSITGKMVWDRIKMIRPLLEIWIVSSNVDDLHTYNRLSRFAYVGESNLVWQKSKLFTGPKSPNPAKPDPWLFRQAVKYVSVNRPEGRLICTPIPGWAKEVRSQTIRHIHNNKRKARSLTVKLGHPFIIVGGPSGAGKSKLGLDLHKLVQNQIQDTIRSGKYSKREVLQCLHSLLDKIDDPQVQETKREALSNTGLEYLYPTIRAWTRGRPIRSGEIQGVQYIVDEHLHLSPSSFDEMVFYVQMFNGYEYGILQAEIELAFAWTSALKDITGKWHPPVSLCRSPAPEALKSLFGAQVCCYAMIPGLAQNLERLTSELERRIIKRGKAEDEVPEREILWSELIHIPDEMGDCYWGLIENPQKEVEIDESGFFNKSVLDRFLHLATVLNPEWEYCP